MITLSTTAFLVLCLIYIHLTFVCYSLYTHRSVAHRAVEFNPAVQHIFRFWLWLTAGVSNKYRVAYHRIHHAYADQTHDPHSPVTMGQWRMLVIKPVAKFLEMFIGVFKKREFVDQLDIRLFLDNRTDSGYVFRFNKFGPFVFLSANVLLFGLQGLYLWIAFVLLALISAYTIADGVGHLYGYRNFKLSNNSHNFFPLGILFAGEELHNNHHATASSANFAVRRFEVDIGYIYIKVLQKLQLATIR